MRIGSAQDICTFKGELLAMLFMFLCSGGSSREQVEKEIGKIQFSRIPARDDSVTLFYLRRKLRKCCVAPASTSIDRLSAEYKISFEYLSLVMDFVSFSKMSANSNRNEEI